MRCRHCYHLHAQAADCAESNGFLIEREWPRRNGIKFHEDLLQKLGQIQHQQEDTIKNFKEGLDMVNNGLHAELDVITQTYKKSLPAEQHLNTRLENLHKHISVGQNAVSDNLDAIKISLSQMRVHGNEDVLRRVFRAELRRVIMPTVEQCLNTSKANPDSQLDEIRRKIDDMAQQLGSKSGGDVQDNLKPSRDPLLEVSSAPTHCHQDLTDSAASGDSEITAFVVPKGQNKFHGRHIQQWRHSWLFHWTIGTLWVTVSTTITNRKRSPVSRIGKVPSPQKAYRVAIEFLPAQSLIQLRGLTLSVASQQDQRGHYQICPLISTFAVVPEDAEIMRFAYTNNVEGIQKLFERRLAAPSDRDEKGRTPLMYAALSGASEVCRLLLNEGSDPLAVDRDGWNAFDVANRAFFNQYRTPRLSVLRDGNWDIVIELMQQAESDIMKPSFTSSLNFIGSIGLSLKEWESLEKPITPDLPYIQRLKELGFRLNFQEDEEDTVTALAIWIHGVNRSPVRFSPRIIRTTLQTILDLGAEIWGCYPLHIVFGPTGRDRTEEWAHNTFEIATALLQNGVDPCALDDFGYSAFDLAEMDNLSSIFLEALERAGYEIEEILHETARRQWCFKNPDHGFGGSTAVDDAQIARPSREGLVSRRAVRGDRLED
ncbi:MAG: hypothetical protein Q9201_005454 [Fulgogasparrea decipioides]